MQVFGTPGGQTAELERCLGRGENRGTGIAERCVTRGRYQKHTGSFRGLHLIDLHGLWSGRLCINRELSATHSPTYSCSNLPLTPNLSPLAGVASRLASCSLHTHRRRRFR